MLKLLLLLTVFHWCHCFAEDECNSDQQIINVFSGTNRTSCSTKNKIKSCPSLELALEQENLNNTCIVLFNSTVERLTKNFTFVNTHNFAIVNNKSHLTVNCSNTVTRTNQTTNIGLAFYSSSNIKIVSRDSKSTFVFHGCGLIHPSWTPAPAGMTERPQLVTTFYFENVDNLVLSTLFLEKYFGYGMVLYDTSGNINITKSSFQENIRLVNSESYIAIDGYRSGGGIHIRYSGNDSQSCGNRIRLQACTFTSLKSDLMRPKNEDDVYKNSYNSFGRGAAVSVFFQKISRNNSISFSQCNFTDNHALWGGGIYLRFSDHSSNNNVTLATSSLQNNSATYAGGAVIIVGSMDLQFCSTNLVRIVDTDFTQNVGQYGGAVCIWRSNINNKDNETIEIENSNFSRNSGKVGSAIYSIISTVVLNNVLLHSNEETPKWDSTGAIGLYMSKVHVKGVVRVRNSGNTAMFLHDSAVFVNGNLTIYNSSGTYGGAMLMLGHSKVHLLHNCVVQFTQNRATDKGGALYVDYPGPPTHRKYSDKKHCFFQFDENASCFNCTLILQGNTARGKRNDIYASTMQPCNNAKTGKYHENITISTDPININASNAWTHISPGIYHHKLLYLQDEFGAIVDGKLEISVKQCSNNESLTCKDCKYDSKNQVSCPCNNTNSRIRMCDVSITNDAIDQKDQVDLMDRKRFFLVSGTQGIDISLVGPQNTLFQLEMSVPSTAAKPFISEILNLTHCPYFFKFKDKDGQCKCSNATDRVNKGISECFANQVYLFIDRWTPELEHDRTEMKETSYRCPYQYCKQCSGNESLTGKDCKYDSKNQCNVGRNQVSRLCSSCLDNYTVSISNNTCHLCPRTESDALYYVKAIAAFGALMISVDFFIIFFIIYANKDVYASYLIPLIYFYKFSNYVIKNPFFNKYESTMGILLLQYFQGSYKSSLIIPNCFIPDLNNLHKLYIYLASSVSWLFAFGLHFVIVTRGVLCLFSRTAVFRALKTVNFMFMAELLFFSFNTLKYVEIGDERYVYVYAEEVYGGDEHMPLMILAILALGFISVYLLIEMFLSLIPITKKLAMCLDSDCAYWAFDSLKNARDSLLNWYKRIAIMSQYGLKCETKEPRDEYGVTKCTADRTWFRFMHTLFLAIFMVCAVYYDDYERNTILTIVCLVFLLLFALMLPYRNEFSNIFEVVVLGDIIMVGVITDLFDGIYSNNVTSVTVTIVLLLLPLILLLFRAVYLFVTIHCNSRTSWYGGSSRESDIVSIPLCIQNVS